MNVKYGICKKCNISLEPVWFIEKEYKCEHGIRYETERVRDAVDYLVCPMCGHKECVDDTFDGNWR